MKQTKTDAGTMVLTHALAAIILPQFQEPSELRVRADKALERIERYNLPIRPVATLLAPSWGSTGYLHLPTKNLGPHDWCLMPVQNDPFYNSGIEMPPEVLRRLQQVRDAGIRFDEIWIAHEIAPGRVNPAKKLTKHLLQPQKTSRPKIPFGLFFRGASGAISFATTVAGFLGNQAAKAVVAEMSRQYTPWGVEWQPEPVQAVSRPRPVFREPEPIKAPEPKPAEETPEPPALVQEPVEASVAKPVEPTPEPPKQHWTPEPEVVVAPPKPEPEPESPAPRTWLSAVAELEELLAQNRARGWHQYRKPEMPEWYAPGCQLDEWRWRDQREEMLRQGKGVTTGEWFAGKTRDYRNSKTQVIIEPSELRRAYPLMPQVSDGELPDYGRHTYLDREQAFSMSMAIYANQGLGWEMNGDERHAEFAVAGQRQRYRAQREHCPTAFDPILFGVLRDPNGYAHLTYLAHWYT